LGTTEIAERIVEAGNGRTISLEIELRSNYSGRGLYGKTTSALVVPDAGTLAAAVGLAAAEAIVTGQDHLPIITAVKAARTDNLGHDLIVY
jgi:hypothetical protein